jgi:hypothetical protein
MIEINRNPSRSELMLFGVLLGLFLALAGAVAFWRFGAARVAYVLWAAAAAAPLVYFALPPVRRPLYLGWMYAAFPIGWAVSHAVMAAAFFGVVTPTGLVMRLFGRDPLARRLDPGAATYWTPRRRAPDRSRYFRQY